MLNDLLNFLSKCNFSLAKASFIYDGKVLPRGEIMYGIVSNTGGENFFCFIGGKIHIYNKQEVTISVSGFQDIVNCRAELDSLKDDITKKDEHLKVVGDSYGQYEKDIELLKYKIDVIEKDFLIIKASQHKH